MIEFPPEEVIDLGNVVIRSMGADYVPQNARVLLDSGANEVVRPYNEYIWSEVVRGRQSGREVGVSLAGGVTARAVQTDGGEIMIKDLRQNENGFRWILPVNRLADG